MIYESVRERYLSSLPRLMTDIGRDNPHSLPSIEKVVVSMGLGGCLGDRKKIEEAAGNLAHITSQKAIVTKAKNAVSGFRLREGVDVGCCVTLRRSRMYCFLTRLLFLALPRVRDFRGLRATSFDGLGNYSFGITDQSVFPEIDTEKTTFIQGMNVSVVTTARNDSEGLLLLTCVGFPFFKVSGDTTRGE